MEKYLDNMDALLPLVVTYAVNIVAAFLIFILGYATARFLRGRVSGLHIGKRQIDPTLKPIVASIVFYIILAMTLYAVLVKLGVPPTSLIAVFGAAGLAIGLALKDTLSNIAAGFMLIALRPLQVGEFVDFGGNAGTVVEIGLFATTLKNVEGLYLYVPNRMVWNGRIQNFGRHTTRKAIIDIGVSYEADLKKTQNILLGVMRDFPDILSQPTPPECYVMNFGDSAMTLSSRCWLPGDNWLARSSDLRVALKSALDEAGIEIPFPQRVITMKNSAADNGVS